MSVAVGFCWTSGGKRFGLNTRRSTDGLQPKYVILYISGRAQRFGGRRLIYYGTGNAVNATEKTAEIELVGGARARDVCDEFQAIVSAVCVWCDRRPNRERSRNALCP